MSKEVKPYSYYDKPDGEEVFQKLWSVLKPASLAAFGVATYDVMLYSQPKGYLKTLGRYAFIGLPLIGITSVFVLATNASASLRKKDDTINWFIGGATAGSLFGVWTRRPIYGFNMAMAMGIVAVAKKYSEQMGYRWIPSDDINIASGGIWSVNQDWTLTKNRPGNWTNGKDGE